MFTTLNFFFKLYTDGSPVTGESAVSMCLSIEAALSPLWIGIEETNDFADIQDQKDHTEAFRRLSGFLAYVSGALRPLIVPTQDERVRIEALNRAEFVIGRVVSHLNCNREILYNALSRTSA